MPLFVVFSIQLKANKLAFFREKIRAFPTAFVEICQCGVFKVGKFMEAKVNLLIIKIDGPNCRGIAYKNATPQQNFEQTIGPTPKKSAFCHAFVDLFEAKDLQKDG